MPTTRSFFSGLPWELVEMIFAKLPGDLWHYLLSCGICQQVRIPLSSINLVPLQAPCLIECDTPWSIKDVDTSSAQENLLLRYFSPSCNATNTLHVPHQNFQHGLHFGAANGTLLQSSEGEGFRLLNPLTGARKDLPHLPPGMCLSSIGCTSFHATANSIYLVARSTALSDLWAWILLHPENESWTRLHIEAEFCDSACASACHRGILFATEEGRPTVAYNAYSGRKLGHIPPVAHEDPVLHSAFLVSTRSHLLRVTRFDGDAYSGLGCSFKIHMLHYENNLKNPSWIPVTSIEDHVLYLERSMVGFSCPPSPNNEGNKIFFIFVDNKPYQWDIASSTVKRVPCQFKYSTWFLPSLEN